MSIFLFIGIVLLSASFGAAWVSRTLRLFGFKEEADEILKISLTLSLFGFMLVMLSYPRPEYFQNAPLLF